VAAQQLAHAIAAGHLPHVDNHNFNGSRNAIVTSSVD
jgi:hypothetical protein